MSLRYGVVFLVGGLEEFGAEGVVVAEVFEVGGSGVGFDKPNLSLPKHRMEAWKPPPYKA